MEKTIVTSMLILAGVVSAVLIFNAVFPALGKSSAAVASMTSTVSDRVRSQVEIIHVTGELDGNGVFQDTNADGYFNVFVWVKNVGSSRIMALDASDVFFGEVGDFARIPYVNDAGGSLPSWTMSLENDTEWRPSATLKITIYFSSPLSSGTYFLKVVAPNGISDEFTFSM